MKKLISDIYQSPVGEIFLAADENELCSLDFNDNDSRIEKLLKQRFGEYELSTKRNFLNMHERLDKYFKGDWQAFDGLAMNTHGTDFQQRVWQSLQTISTGDAISYEQLAGKIKNPKAVRAVASTNASNPIAVIIPCHRVIGKNGSLRGYTGGIDRQAWLLQHEGYPIL